MRLDLARPLTKGNVIIFKGERATGKTRLASSVINKFVQEDPENHHAIYVGLSSAAGDEILHSTSNNVLCLTTDEANVAQSEYLFGPRAALHAL